VIVAFRVVYIYIHVCTHINVFKLVNMAYSAWKNRQTDRTNTETTDGKQKYI